MLKKGPKKGHEWENLPIRPRCTTTYVVWKAMVKILNMPDLTRSPNFKFTELVDGFGR